jgi:hypothetical protein
VPFFRFLSSTGSRSSTMVRYQDSLSAAKARAASLGGAAQAVLSWLRHGLSFD